MTKHIIFNYLRILFIALIWLFAAACATVVKPSGGAADRTAPEFQEAYPPDSTINFQENKIILEFNEFIKLNNPRSQVLMNPFISQNIDIIARGKKVIIKLPDSLSDAGTYHIFFGNAVQDITEGNVSTNLHYVFSTKSYLDSCSINGYVINAFENNPNADSWVMLHKEFKNFKDTTPVYLAHASEKGAFQFSNLKPGKYHAFALMDANSDYKFSLANESLGFYENIVELSAENPRIDSIKIRLFENIDTIQKRIKSEVIRFRTVRVGYKQSMKNPQIVFPDSKKTYYEWDKNKDTVLFWIDERSLDRLACIIKDGIYSDTIQQELNVKLRFSKILSDTSLQIFNNLVNGKLNHFDTLRLHFLAPVISIDTAKIRLISEDDTIHYTIQKSDSIGKVWNIVFNIIPDSSGALEIDSGAIVNIFGHCNDSTVLKWENTSDDDFGSMIITISPPLAHPYIVQISENNTIQEKYFEAYNDTIRFEKLFPGSYSIKIIVDKDKNGKYTTGDYELQRQPEAVFTLPRPIAVQKGFVSRTLWSL